VDHRGFASKVVNLEPLVTRQENNQLPPETCRARTLLSQKLDGGGGGARAQKRGHTAAR
jgi:hypothetical protein